MCHRLIFLLHKDSTLQFHSLNGLIHTSAFNGNVEQDCLNPGINAVGSQPRVGQKVFFLSELRSWYNIDRQVCGFFPGIYSVIETDAVYHQVVLVIDS